jgi:hypothetical protein
MKVSFACAHQGVALFKKDGAAAQTGDMNHLAINVARGIYESLKAELESHGISCRRRPSGS